jgi:hypothetical protein
MGPFGLIAAKRAAASAGIIGRSGSSGNYLARHGTDVAGADRDDAEIFYRDL